jgi:hypothetical protein
MHTLMIFQTPTWSPFDRSQTLFVDLIPRTQEIEFRFQDYRKVCPASDGFKTLVFILSERLRWISGLTFTEPNENG